MRIKIAHRRKWFELVEIVALILINKAEPIYDDN